MKQQPVITNDSDNTPPVEEQRGFASPPCLRHEIDPAYGGDSIEENSEPGPETLQSTPQER